MAFHGLWNGMSVAVHPDDVAKLRDLPGVAEIYPARVVESPEPPQTFDPELLTALAMTGADIAHSELGLTGAGVKVGIIDTGADYDHPDLGGDGVPRRNSSVFPTARVVAGYDFVGDRYTGVNTPAPDPYPDDCYGHGTHVAGIVAAKGAVTGVAPGCVLGVYRVFGCKGNTTSDLLIAAMERALDDGMQVVNLSVGNAFKWPSEPTAKACDRLVKRGVVVCAAMGNSGGLGLYAASTPGVARDAIGVAAFDNTHFNTPAFLVTSDTRVFTYILAGGSLPAPLSGTYPLARTGSRDSLADACLPLPPGTLSGKVALIRRGTCSSYSKALAAQDAGAVAVVLYNNELGDFVPEVKGIVRLTIPVVAITMARGELLDGRLEAGPVDLTWTLASTPNALTGGFVSSFSSYGPSPDLSLKPDLGAPGGFITSTYPLELGGYTSYSGTSMATPHVAGAAALLMQAHPGLSPHQVRTRLMNSARPRAHRGDPAGFEVVHLQGAGMLDIAAAALATAQVEPEKLELGESESGPAERTLTITNHGAAEVTFTLSHQPALATGPDTFSPTTMEGGASVSFATTTVRVPAGHQAEVRATITVDPAVPEGSLYGGYIVLTPDDGRRELRVPYAGYVGDYQAAPVLTSTILGTPALTRQMGSAFLRQPHGATFDMTGLDVPDIVLHLDRPSSELKIEIFAAPAGHPWHQMFLARDYPRNVGDQGESVFPWLGTTTWGRHRFTEPDGQYVAKVSVLKPLGNPGNPEHWETWTSPVITLVRPVLAAVSPPTLSQSPVHSGDEVLVSATVGNAGINPASDVKVVFYDDGVAFDSATVAVQPSQSQEAQVAWAVGKPGIHAIKVVVDPDGRFLELDRTDNVAETRVTVESDVLAPPPRPATELRLAPALPNPSGGGVEFQFELPAEGPVAFDIYDMLGRRLRSWRWSALPAGPRSLTWDGRADDGRDAPAGVLLFRLQAAGRTLTRKV
ncbi:MAG: hypothetical protein E6K81_14975, partial [Candidatus Eisenbacteria bacterium]